MRCSTFKLPQRSPSFIAAKQKLWRLHEPEVQVEDQNFMKECCADVTRSCVENAWNNLKDCLLIWGG